MRGRRSGKRSRGGRSSPLARRLRVGARHPSTRAASGTALGALGPLCEELADGPPDNGTRKRGPELGEYRRAFARAAAERREAPRWAIPPGISGDPEIGLSARTATGAALPHQRLSALCSPHFSGEPKTDKGHPPRSTGPAERWLNDRPLDKKDRY